MTILHNYIFGKKIRLHKGVLQHKDNRKECKAGTEHKRLHRYLSYRGISSDITEYGYEYSWRRYSLTTLIMEFVFLTTGILFQISWPGILTILLIGFLCLPHIIRVQYSYLHQCARFREVDLYIHQMAYSFERQPKINMALLDAGKIVSGKMRKCIEEALDELKYGVSSSIYQDALEHVQNNYQCTRIRTLHKFLIGVEQRGGEHKNSLELLVWDYDRWCTRVYRNQEELKRVKHSSEIGIILSILISFITTMSTWILKSAGDIKISIVADPVYQLSSTAFLVCMILYNAHIQNRFNKDWLGQERSEQDIMHDYQLAYKTSTWNIRKKTIPIYIAFIAAILISLFLGYFLVSIGCTLTLLVILAAPDLNKKEAQKRLKDDIYLAFAEWLRELALNLEEEPLQSAIEETYDDCPAILKESLQQFIYAMEEDPSDVTAYYSFLNMFHLFDISSTIRTLYSLTEQETEHKEATINTLMRRNIEMIDKHEQSQCEDMISVLRFCEYVPTIFVSLKIAADMLLVITNYL